MQFATSRITRKMKPFVASYVLPLVLHEGLPYYRCQTNGRLVLIDTGASCSILSNEILDGDDVMARAGRRCSARPPSGFSLPPFCCGIAGYDFLRELSAGAEGARRSAIFDLRDRNRPALVINSPVPAEMHSPCELVDSPLFPLVHCDIFGVENCNDVVAVVDTGSPVTIANTAVDFAAGLFDCLDAPSLDTANADGSINKLTPKLCAGLRIGRRIDRPHRQLYVADLPAMRYIDRAKQMLLGLDVLGTHFAFEFFEPVSPARVKKKSRRSSPPSWDRPTQGAADEALGDLARPASPTSDVYKSRSVLWLTAN